MSLATATKEVVTLLGGDRFPKLESPSLRLEKFVRISEATKKENYKKDEIESVVVCHDKNRRPIPPTVPPQAISFLAKLGGRLIVNQAGGLLENAGLCLHRHFGDPYLPGSAVKGIARHAAWCAWNAESDQHRKTEIAKNFAVIFGYPTGDPNLNSFLEDMGIQGATSGNVCFLPAIPATSVRLVTDIVNCHHPQYYGAKQDEATDNESSNPQFFPAIEAGSEFRFTLIPSTRLGTMKTACLAQAQEWLITALTQHGAGAKTAAGYGWFEYDAEKVKQEEAAERQRQAEKQQQAQAAAAEAARLAALDPIEREMEIIRKLPQEPFAHFAKALKDKTEPEQRAFIRLLNHKDKKDWWKTKKKKDESLAKAILEIAGMRKEPLS